VKLPFAEVPAGAPEAVKAWFYPGEAIGDELIYPKGEARRIAGAAVPADRKKWCPRA
jgi:hypothetical protein